MSYSPPAAVRSNAARGLELRAKHNRGGTAVGVARGRDLSNGTSVSLDTIKRMNSYFARHEVDKKGEGWGVDSAGYIAWLLWGGDAGWSWAKGILREEEKKDKSAMEITNSYAEIIKSEKQADGTLKVYGKATDDGLDIDSQICDEAWLKKAMPDWFTTGGNIREQHSNIAAGVATDYESKADGHYITALVVDPVSVKKVETGVLKGFSIGIRGPRVVRDEKAANGRIIDGQIVEVSLVDRPANPNAKLMLAKAAESGELMAVTQTATPADVARMIAKSDDAETTETIEPEVEEVAVEETTTETEEVKEDEVVIDVDPETEATVKGLLADLIKFDQGKYDAAITAISDLIIVEANEQKAGSDERRSIKELLHAVKHLYHWYQGEVAEGEVANANPEIAEDALLLAGDLNLSADACGCGDCDACEGCDDKLCKCSDSMKAATPDLGADQVTGIIEKAVASARESVTAELELLKAANTAAEQKAAELQTELEIALSKAAAGGPKRTAAPKTEAQIDQLLTKAANYRALASATQDKTLEKGYIAIAEDLEKDARKGRKDT